MSFEYRKVSSFFDNRILLNKLPLHPNQKPQNHITSYVYFLPENPAYIDPLQKEYKIELMCNYYLIWQQ